MRIARFVVPLALALTACGGAKEGNTIDGHKPVTLRLLWWQNAKEGPFKVLLEGFHKKYPWITVKPESVPYTAYYQKVGAYVAAKSGPDLMVLEEGGHWSPYKRALRPLDDMDDALKSIFMPEYFCADYDCSKDVYGVGFTRQGHVLYYNKDILSKAGVDPENPPRTFADMATVCQKVKAIGKDCWAVGGKDLGLPLVMGAEAVKVATQSQMLDLAAGKAKWTDPEFVQLLEIMAKIGREGWYQKGYQADGFGTQEPGVFESGRTAFALGLMGDGLNWSDFGTIMGFDKIGVVGLPDVGDGVPAGVQAGPLNGTIGVALNIGLSVPTWSAHPKEAELLIRYAVDPTVQRAMVEVTKGPFPALKTAEASWNSQPAFGQLLDMAANSKAAGLLAYIGFGYLLPLNAQLQSLSAGKTTPQAAAEAIQKAAEAVRSS